MGELIRRGMGQLCSTPFGIKDQLRSWRNPYDRHHIRCSTPFGIKDQLSSIKIYKYCATKCAQRLSASKINSVNYPHQVEQETLCSTPFGIKDQLSALPFPYFPVSFVLNAFRHQRSTQSRPRDLASGNVSAWVQSSIPLLCLPNLELPMTGHT